MTGIFSGFQSFFSTLSASEFMMGWREEKEKMLSKSQEERRKGYWCGNNFTPLEEVNTWAEDESNYDRNQAQQDKIKEELLNFEMNFSLDLSKKVSLYQGDITKLEIDAIVNAANESLLGGGGVDGAIHRAAGPLLQQENRTLNGCKVGEAKISGGYQLPAKYVISTVGPRGEYPNELERAYKNSLKTLVDNGLKSIAFPCISTGVFGYPNDAACCVALRTVRKFLETNHKNVDRVVFCTFLPVDIQIYNQRMPIIFPSRPDGDGLAEERSYNRESGSRSRYERSDQKGEGGRCNIGSGGMNGPEDRRSGSRSRHERSDQKGEGGRCNLGSGGMNGPGDRRSNPDRYFN